MQLHLTLVASIGLLWIATACQSAPPAPPTAAPPMGAMSAGSPNTSENCKFVGDCLQSQREMVESLQSGGFVLYFRHGATDATQADSDPTNLANCATQRNLTDAGRAQARSIGEAFRTLGIPVGRVLSSQYCRAVEYSQLAFGTWQAEPSLNLTDPLGEDQKTDSVRQMKHLLATPPETGRNTILVSHAPNIRLVANIDLPVEGEAAIFRVDVLGVSTFVMRVMPTDWTLLAQAVSASS